MPITPTYYDLLGVKANAAPADIKRAYYAKMRQHHPDSLMAERARLQIVGDKNALRTLDKRLEDAKKITQRLNVAYDTLSDPIQRAIYDRKQLEAQALAQRMAQDDPRIVVSQRPHRPAPAPVRTQHQYSPSPAAKPDKFPTAWIVGFIAVLFVTFALLSPFFSAGIRTEYLVLPSQTAPGSVPVGSTDATRRASDFATATSYYLLTTTPRTLDSYLLAGDRFYEDTLYKYAIEQYTLALALEPTPETFVKRGRAHVALLHEAEALSDFDTALTLDANFAPAYAARGLLYFARWRVTKSTDDANQVQADLTRAQELGDTSADVQQALEVLVRR